MNKAVPSNPTDKMTVTTQKASWGGTVIEMREGEAELRVAVQIGTAPELLKLARDDRYRAARLLERAEFIERAAQVLASPESANPVLPSIARS